MLGVVGVSISRAGIEILDYKEIVGYLYYVAYPFAGEDNVDLLYC